MQPGGLYLANGKDIGLRATHRAYKDVLSRSVASVVAGAFDERSLALHIFVAFAFGVVANEDVEAVDVSLGCLEVSVLDSFD